MATSARRLRKTKIGSSPTLYLATVDGILITTIDGKFIVVQSTN